MQFDRNRGGLPSAELMSRVFFSSTEVQFTLTKSQAVWSYVVKTKKYLQIRTSLSRLVLYSVHVSWNLQQAGAKVNGWWGK